MAAHKDEIYNKITAFYNLKRALVGEDEAKLKYMRLSGKVSIINNSPSQWKKKLTLAVFIQILQICYFILPVKLLSSYVLWGQKIHPLTKGKKISWDKCT